jgi:hypothetical protein
LGMALRNVYVIGLLVGIAMLILGLRFPARPPTDDPA